MEPHGHINATEIVKVERHSSGLGGKWLISDQSKNHVEARTDELIWRHVKEALGDDAEGYFQGQWSVHGWNIGDRVRRPKA
jgi:hypothetical protein